MAGFSIIRKQREKFIARMVVSSTIGASRDTDRPAPSRRTSSSPWRSRRSMSSGSPPVPTGAAASAGASERMIEVLSVSACRTAIATSPVVRPSILAWAVSSSCTDSCVPSRTMAAAAWAETWAMAASQSAWVSSTVSGAGRRGFMAWAMIPGRRHLRAAASAISSIETPSTAWQASFSVIGCVAHIASTRSHSSGK
ncbi:hypothetical protein D3C85_1022000 [compost metagenome]